MQAYLGSAGRRPHSSQLQRLGVISELATAIQKAVMRYRATNSVPITRRVRVRRRDFTLRYEEDFGFANFRPERIPDGVVKTGLPMCPREKKSRKVDCGNEQDTFSGPV